MLTVPETFATGRLILRRPVLADAEAVFEYARDPDVTRFMDWSTHTNSEAAIQFLESVIPRWDSGDEFYWAICWPIRPNISTQPRDAFVYARVRSAA
ncbi:MAG TPA: GNAT family N-acetyltransferase [Planctomycetaceae bacterium]|nr:GNAT family N-acetyltransferase [Planctomycetaceae bacterium]